MAAFFIDSGPNINLATRPPDDYLPGSKNTGRQNIPVHKLNMPWQGNNGTSRDNAYRVGRIVAPAAAQSNGTGAINRFLFHYNPQSVTVQMTSSDTIRPSSDMLVPDTFAQPNATETMAFDFLLNRIPDVSFQTDAATGAASTYGTLYDLYYLWGLINRNFGDDLTQFDYPNTDVGILNPNVLTVIFGELFRFIGYVNSVSIQHAKFIASPKSSPTSAPLIPVLTNVSMSLTRAPGGMDYGGTEPDPSGTGSTGTGPSAPDQPQGSMPPTTSPPSDGNGLPGQIPGLGLGYGSPTTSGGTGASTYY